MSVHLRASIITIGKPKADHIRTGIAHYEKLLRSAGRVNLVHLKGSSGSPERQRTEDTARLLASASEEARTFLLTEHGKARTTPALVELLREPLALGTPLEFLIGGPYGVTSEGIAKADATLSLSPLTMPHELALLVLMEQLFRVCAVVQGKTYHH